MTEATTIPEAPGKLPLLGHALPLMRDPLAFLSSLPAVGDLVRIQLGTLRAIMVTDPELTRKMLLDDHSFGLGGPLFDRVREAAGDIMVTPPEKHRRQRRLMQPAFANPRLSGYATAMAARVAALTESWHDGQVFDITAEMTTLTVQTVLDTMFSGGLSPDEIRQAIEDLETLFEGFYRRAMMPPLVAKLPTPGNRSYLQAIARLRAQAGRIIAERRISGEDHGDLLSALLAARDAESEVKGLDDIEISDVIVVFFIAGVQSTASLLAWALQLASAHPELGAQLRAEADSVLNGGPATYEHLTKLPLATKFVTETLRMYPPGWMLTRTATASTDLGGQPMPEGTFLFYSPYLLQRRAELYPDPDRFDPSRWDERPPLPQAFFAFGQGPRKCIGEAFGLTEATLALATIVSRWELEPVTDEPARAAVAFALHPRKLRMRVTARTPQPAVVAAG
jgi:pentalenene oxygenase